MPSQNTPREIPLSRGLVAIVDEADYAYLSQFKWYARDSASQTYAARQVRISGKQRAVRMHREIMNAKDVEIVDHINGDGLDNRRENLRICTNRENSWNTAYRHHAKLPQGVYNSPKGGYEVRISAKGFDSVEEAHAAYEDLLSRIRGEFYRPPE